MRAILRRVDWLALGALSAWCASVFAQVRAASFGAELSQVEPLIWLLVIGLSLAGGMVSLLPKLHDPMHRIGSRPIVIAGHLSGSLVAGLLMFFKGNSEGMNDWDLAIAILIAGFSGAWVLEIARARLFGVDSPSEPDRRSGVDRREG